MKVLLDEDLPHPLARKLPGHEVETVASMGWSGVKNGSLLALVEREQFEAFVTADKNMQNQQKLGGRPFAVLVLSTASWKVIKENVPAVQDALEHCAPGLVETVDCGKFIPRRLRAKSDPKP